MNKCIDWLGLKADNLSIKTKYGIKTMTFQVFPTKEEATVYAISKFSEEYVEFNIVNVIKIGPTMARILGCENGWAIDKEMDGEK